MEVIFLMIFFQSFFFCQDFQIPVPPRTPSPRRPSDPVAFLEAGGNFDTVTSALTTSMARSQDKNHKLLSVPADVEGEVHHSEISC